MIISAPDIAQCPHQAWIIPHLTAWHNGNLTSPLPLPRMGLPHTDNVQGHGSLNQDLWPKQGGITMNRFEIIH